jgi:hypothetical protein
MTGIVKSPALRWLRRRLPASGDETGSLPMLMLVILVGMALSALLIPTIITHFRSTQNEIERVHALGAAQTGFDVALGQIRAAKDSTGAGVSAAMPCGPLTGAVSAGSRARYQISIGYYATDPVGQSATWLVNNKMICAPGFATKYVPSFALLTSIGTDRATGAFGLPGDRTLTTTYIIKTTNQNISGGLIRIYHDATLNNLDLCMDAGSGTPATGTILLMQTCDITRLDRQIFSYNLDLTIQLVSSKTTPMPLGLCMDAGALPHTMPIRSVRLQPCTATAQPNQQWSLNDVSNFEGSTAGGALDGYCIDVGTSNTPGSQVVLDNTAGKCRTGYSIIQTWVPEPAVGAGAAGQSINGQPAPQLVNFKQFGRCLDVTNQSTSSTFLIAYPCKQAPNPANVAWNQKFSYSSTTQRFITTPSSTSYCLQSPQNVAAAQYVLTVACPGTSPANLKWVYNGSQDSAGVELSYAKKYTIVDATGYCMALSPDTDRYNGAYNKVIVAICDGSVGQKWNADPNVQVPALQDTWER